MIQPTLDLKRRCLQRANSIPAVLQLGSVLLYCYFAFCYLCKAKTHLRKRCDFIDARAILVIINALRLHMLFLSFGPEKPFLFVKA